MWVQPGSHFWVHLAQAFVECMAILLFKLYFPVNHSLSAHLLRLLKEVLEVNLIPQFNKHCDSVYARHFARSQEYRTERNQKVLSCSERKFQYTVVVL